MTDTNEDLDLQFLKNGPAVRATSDDDYEEDSDECRDLLDQSNLLLKNTAILLQYLGDENFCKNITKRERNIIAKHVDRIYDLTDQVQALLEEE